MACLGDNIKSRRKQLFLTLEDVAKKIGVTKQTVQKYENGVIANVPSDKIELLAKALETTPGDLMGWNEKPPAEAEGDVLTEEEVNWLELFRAQPPEVKKAWMALLEAAEARDESPDESVKEK